MGEQFRLASEEVGEEAHVVRMIGDDEEIERTGKLHWLSTGGHDLLAFGEAIGFLRSEAATSRARIE